MLQRLVFLGLFSCLMACDLYVDTKPNEAWRRCKADPCSDGCSADLRATYCDYYVDDPKCDQCWSRSEGGIDGSDSGNDARVDSGDELGGDGGAALCKRDENCSVDEPRCDKGECTGCRDSTDCADREATPACDSSSGACVTCTESDPGACTGTKPLCKSGGNECVECNDRNDCDESVPHCNDDNTCGKCVTNEDCGRWGKVCDAGQCVQCTPETEAVQCPDVDPSPGDQGPACDPAAKTCTGQPRGSVSGCGACVSDSECETGSLCLTMKFGTSPHGSYCLQIAPSGLCPNGAPSKEAAMSVLGIEGEYCFPVESLTTCEAILNFKDACIEDSECGAAELDDGLCVGPDGAKRCTYACSGSADCAGAICTGPVGTKYCEPN